jgi:hypothetical protein
MRAIRYLLDCLHLSTAQSCCVGVLPVDGQETPELARAGASELDSKGLPHRGEWPGFSATELAAMTNSGVDEEQRRISRRQGNGYPSDLRDVK